MQNFVTPLTLRAILISLLFNDTPKVEAVSAIIRPRLKYKSLINSQRNFGGSFGPTISQQAFSGAKLSSRTVSDILASGGKPRNNNHIGNFEGANHSMKQLYSNDGDTGQSQTNSNAATDLRAFESLIADAGIDAPVVPANYFFYYPAETTENSASANMPFSNSRSPAEIGSFQADQSRANPATLSPWSDQNIGLAAETIEPRQQAPQAPTTFAPYLQSLPNAIAGKSQGNASAPQIAAILMNKEATQSRPAVESETPFLPQMISGQSARAVGSQNDSDPAKTVVAVVALQEQTVGKVQQHKLTATTVNPFDEAMAELFVPANYYHYYPEADPLNRLETSMPMPEALPTTPQPYVASDHVATTAKPLTQPVNLSTLVPLRTPPMTYSGQPPKWPKPLINREPIDPSSSLDIKKGLVPVDNPYLQFLANSAAATLLRKLPPQALFISPDGAPIALPRGGLIRPGGVKRNRVTAAYGPPLRTGPSYGSRFLGKTVAPQQVFPSISLPKVRRPYPPGQQGVLVLKPKIANKSSSSSQSFVLVSPATIVNAIAFKQPSTVLPYSVTDRRDGIQTTAIPAIAGISQHLLRSTAAPASQNVFTLPSDGVTPTNVADCPSGQLAYYPFGRSEPFRCNGSVRCPPLYNCLRSDATAGASYCCVDSRSVAVRK